MACEFQRRLQQIVNRKWQFAMESPRRKQFADAVAAAGGRRARQRAGHGRRGHRQNAHARRALPGLPRPRRRVALMKSSSSPSPRPPPPKCASASAACWRKNRCDDPDDPHWREQLALFDAAHIGTLHGFCFKLVREHFYELGLDPQLAVLDEGEARLLADETLEEAIAGTIRRPGRIRRVRFKT